MNRVLAEAKKRGDGKWLRNDGDVLVVVLKQAPMAMTALTGRTETQSWNDWQ
jgi:hypothetical protein